MAGSTRLGLVLVIWLGFLAPAAALADCSVKPGTVITKPNWTQYKDCFTYGEQRFWQGDLFWKMPEDVEIHVGQEHRWTLPKPYVDATEKYGGQTRLVKQPDGLYRLENYVAGLPFPNPSEPDKGTKMPPMSLTKCRATSGANSQTWATHRPSLPGTALATQRRRSWTIPTSKPPTIGRVIRVSRP